MKGMGLAVTGQTLWTQVSSSAVVRWYVPPLFFVAFASLRVYVETELLAAVPRFSHTVLVHHVSWMFSVALWMILLAHLLLKRRVSDLLWLMYGCVLMAIPPLCALVTGTDLELDYLRGSLSDVAFDILTFCATSDKNGPLFPEIVAIFLSMLVVGRVMGRSWRKGLSLAAAAHISGMLLATYWIGFSRQVPGFLTVDSLLPKHAGHAAQFLTVGTLLAAALLVRSGLAGCARRTLWHALDAAVALGAVVIMVFCASGVSPHPFDRAIVGVPAAAGGAVLALAAQADGRKQGGRAWACVGGVALFNVLGWTVVLMEFSH